MSSASRCSRASLRCPVFHSHRRRSAFFGCSSANITCYVSSNSIVSWICSSPMTSQVSVFMDAPTIRTRLISPPPSQQNDFCFIYVSILVTATVLLSSAFLVWRWGLHGFGTHLSVALAIALLIFNAYLGAKTWADLHQQNQNYLKHQIRPVPHIRPTEKFWRSAASPVWIERNAYYENGRCNHTANHVTSDMPQN